MGNVMIDGFGRVTVEITRDQLEVWAGRVLSDDEVARIDVAIPGSSIPEAIGCIAESVRGEAG